MPLNVRQEGDKLVVFQTHCDDENYVTGRIELASPHQREWFCATLQQIPILENAGILNDHTLKETVLTHEEAD